MKKWSFPYHVDMPPGIEREFHASNRGVDLHLLRACAAFGILVHPFWLYWDRAMAGGTLSLENVLWRLSILPVLILALLLSYQPGVRPFAHILTAVLIPTTVIHIGIVVGQFPDGLLRALASALIPMVVVAVLSSVGAAAVAGVSAAAGYFAVMLAHRVPADISVGSFAILLSFSFLSILCC